MGSNTRAELESKKDLAFNLRSLAVNKFVGYDMEHDRGVMGAYRHACALYSLCEGLKDGENDAFILQATDAFVFAHERLERHLIRFFRGSHRFFRTRLFSINPHKRFRKKRAEIFNKILVISVEASRIEIDLATAAELYFWVDSALHELRIAQAEFKTQRQMHVARETNYWRRFHEQQNLLET